MNQSFRRDASRRAGAFGFGSHFQRSWQWYVQFISAAQKRRYLPRFLPAGILAGVVLVASGLLVAGSVAALVLTSLPQELRQMAAGAGCDNGVPIGGTACRAQGEGVQFRCQAGSTPTAPIWSEESCNGGRCSGASCQGATQTATAPTTTSSQPSQPSTGGACAGVFCGGCLNRCVPWTEFTAQGITSGGCNAIIDRMCQQATCGGEGTSPGAGQQCCAGLQLCANGRCGQTCALDSNPLCPDGKRSGSNCGITGKLACTSTGSVCQGDVTAPAVGGTTPTTWDCFPKGFCSSSTPRKEACDEKLYFSTKTACEGGSVLPCWKIVGQTCVSANQTGAASLSVCPSGTYSTETACKTAAALMKTYTCYTKSTGCNTAVTRTASCGSLGEFSNKTECTCSLKTQQSTCEAVSGCQWESLARVCTAGSSTTSTSTTSTATLTMPQMPSTEATKPPTTTTTNTTSTTTQPANTSVPTTTTTTQTSNAAALAPCWVANARFQCEASPDQRQIQPSDCEKVGLSSTKDICQRKLMGQCKAGSRPELFNGQVQCVCNELTSVNPGQSCPAPVVQNPQTPQTPPQTGGTTPANPTKPGIAPTLNQNQPASQPELPTVSTLPTCQGRTSPLLQYTGGVKCSTGSSTSYHCSAPKVAQGWGVFVRCVDPSTNSVSTTVVTDVVTPVQQTTQSTDGVVPSINPGTKCADADGCYCGNFYMLGNVANGQWCKLSCYERSSIGACSFKGLFEASSCPSNWYPTEESCAANECKVDGIMRRVNDRFCSVDGKHVTTLTSCSNGVHLSAVECGLNEKCRDGECVGAASVPGSPSQATTQPTQSQPVYDPVVLPTQSTQTLPNCENRRLTSRFTRGASACYNGVGPSLYQCPADQPFVHSYKLFNQTVWQWCDKEPVSDTQMTSCSSICPSGQSCECPSQCELMAVFPDSSIRTCNLPGQSLPICTRGAWSEPVSSGSTSCYDSTGHLSWQCPENSQRAWVAEDNAMGCVTIPGNMCPAGTARSVTDDPVLEFSAMCYPICEIQDEATFPFDAQCVTNSFPGVVTYDFFKHG